MIKKGEIIYNASFKRYEKVVKDDGKILFVTRRFNLIDLIKILYYKVCRFFRGD